MTTKFALQSFIIILLVILGLNHRLIRGQQQRLNLFNQDANINDVQCFDTDSTFDCSLYKSIDSEQSALHVECDKLMNRKLEDIDQVMNHNIIHFEPSPLPIKIPAICWLVQTIDRVNQGPKPDLISWVYDPLSTVNEIVPAISTDYDVTTGTMTTTSSSKTGVPVTPVNGLFDIQSPITMQHEKIPAFPHTGVIQPEVKSNAISQVGPSPAISSQNLITKSGTPTNSVFGLGKDGKFHASQLTPVIIIPGLMGSRLEDKLNKTHTVHWWCTKNSGWQEGFWLSMENFLPFVLDCWLDNMRLEYDPSTGFAKSPEGVEVRTGPFGKIETVLSMDSTFTIASSYMDHIIEKLVSMGYEADVNVLAAPYDFRLAPQQLAAEGEYFDKLTRLIESTQAGVGYGNPVTLLCHSMGCPNAIIYLRSKTPEWRAIHIVNLITVSAPWGGSVVAAVELIAGGAVEIPLISDKKLRDLARTMPSISYLLPLSEVFADNHVPIELSQKPLVITPNRTYGIQDMGQLLLDANLTRQYQWYHSTTSLLKPSEPLQDVRLVCVHGTDMATPRTLIYKLQEHFPDGKHEIEFGDGDGTVNRESLSVCKKWARDFPERIQNIEVFSTNHVEVLKEDVMLNLIEKEVLMYVNSK